MSALECTARQYRNGYQIRAAPPPDYIPYSLKQRGLKQDAFAAGNPSKLRARAALTETAWNELARKEGEIPRDAKLRPFQWECANHVITRAGDLVVIAPTGSGKSKLYSLPLRVNKKAVSLVVVPYTCLGKEATSPLIANGLNATFLYSENKSEAELGAAAVTEGLVLFVCPEMLESPSFARVIHATGFINRLSAIYLDEIHLAKETREWRTAYKRIHSIRGVVGDNIPLVVMSATLPIEYRTHLVSEIGLKADYKLINLGNFRPELSTVVIHMEHPASSFLDLSFLLPAGSTVASLLLKPTLIYCDDCDELTEMFWWFYDRLAAAGLPTTLVDVLHAGLSDEHATLALRDLRSGRLAFLLGSEKIGPGIDVPNIARVCQFKMRDMSIVRVAQRGGRGARKHGKTSITYLFFEPSMLAKDNNILDPDLSSQDPHVLRLGVAAARGECCDNIFEEGLGNPPRDRLTARAAPCCSTCHPQLRPGREYRWQSWTPPAAKDPVLADTQLEDAVRELAEWRLTIWRDEWKLVFPGFGPRDLVSDDDLRYVAKNLQQIQTQADLESRLSLFDVTTIAPALFRATRTVCNRRFPPKYPVWGVNEPAAELRRKATAPHPEAPASKKRKGPRCIPSENTVWW